MCPQKVRLFGGTSIYYDTFFYMNICDFLYSFGVTPVCSLKILLKYLALPNPDSAAIFPMSKLVVVRKFFAILIL